MRLLLRHIVHLLTWSGLLAAGLGGVWHAHAQEYSVEPPRFIFDDVDKGYDLLFRPDHIIRVQWPTEYNLSNATLRWARSPAALATSERAASATGGDAFIDVTAEALDMAVGQWYGQIFADQGVSNVFFIYVESETPPTAAVLNPESEVPTFEVTPVPGVPAYGIGVSDTPFTVRLDPDGDLAVEGLSLIWRYVGATGETSIPYARDAVNPVPLERGRTYYYIVFNAYEPSDVRFLSSVNAGVFTFKNGIDPSQLAAPTLGTPGPDATLSDETLRFTWDAVDNGDRYKVTVLQEYELLGSVGEIEVWSTTVIGDGEGGQQLSVDFDARRVLTRDTYRWFVSAESLTLGESKASERRSFDYLRPVANLALVIQQVGGQPLSGVQVDVASTDFIPRDGQLDLQNATRGTFELPLGTYTLTFSKEGHRTTTRTVTLSESDATVTEVVALPALTTTVQGIVTDTDGQPLFGAAVAVAGGEATDRTDAGGVYQLFLEAGGPVTLHATATGFAAVQRTINATDGGTTTGVDFTLTPDRATVSGRVANSAGRGLALASLTATHSDGRTVTRRTDGNGNYALVLGSGTWQLVAELQGFQQAQTSVTLALDQDITQDFQLEAAQQEVIVDVQHAQGPLVDASVTTRVAGRTITQRADAQGQARFSIPAGRYAFHIEAAGHATATVYASLLPTMTTLRLPAQLQEHTLLVQGQVQDARGSVPDASVEVYRCDRPRPADAELVVDLRVGTAAFTCLGGVRRINQTTTDEAGVYRLPLPRFPGGTAPAYLVRAHHPSGERGTAHDVLFPVDDRPMTLNLTLPLGAGRLTGQLRARSGRDVRAEQLAVALRSAAGNGQYVAYPDRNGFFTLSAPYGTYTLQAIDRNGLYNAGAPETVQLQPGQGVPARTLEVVETDQLWSGTVNVPSATVTLQQGEMAYETRAAANGAFGLRVPAGTYHARIRSDGWLPARQPVTVAAAQPVTASPSTTSITLQQASTSVRGQVRTTEGALLERARVRVLANGVPTDTVFTDARGRYVVEATEGLVRLIAERAGYAPAEQQLLLALGQPVTGIDMVLQPRLATLTGSIRDDDNAPLQGSRLVVLSAESGGRTLSGADGAVTLTGLIPGRYTVGITQCGYETVTLQNIPLQQGFNPITARQVQQQARLDGTVRTTDAAPLADATVTVAYADGTTFTALTGSDGAFRFDNLAAGEASVTASKTGFASASGAQAVLLVAGQVRTVTFDDLVRTSGRIVGVVRSTAGTPLQQVSVSATLGEATTSAQTDADGRYQLDNLSAGQYTLSATRTGFTTATASVDLPANGEATQDFTLQPNAGRIVGRVLDQDGDRLGFATTVIASSATLTRTASTDDDGAFTLTGLAIGTVYSVRTAITTEGYDNADADVEIPAAGAASLTLQVDVTRGEIQGDVGIDGATVVVIDVATTETVRTIPVTSSGTYRATLLAAGTYRIRPERTGFTFTPASREVAVSKDGEATASFTANSVQATLVVRTLRAGEPLSDVQVTVTSSDGAITETATTDAEGTARFASLTGGLSYTVGATRMGFQTSPATQTLTLAVGATETIQFTLTESTARLSGTVRAEGERLPGALLTATTSTGVTFTTTQPAAAPYVLASLPAATYTITATRDGYRSAEQTVALSDGEARDDVNFDLIPELVRLTGQVRYAGEGLAEIAVTATGPTTRSAVTDADGRFSITAPLSGAATDTTVYVVGIGGDGTLPQRTAVLSLTGAQTGTTVEVPPFVVPSGQVVLTLTDGLQPLPGITVQLVGEAGQFQTGQTDAAGRFASSATLERGTYRMAVSTPDRLLPDEAQFRAVLEDDTERVVRTVVLPYQFAPPSTVTSNDPTPIRVAFPAGFAPDGATARVTYRPTESAPQETRLLARQGNAFAGTLPPTFSLDPIEVTAQVQAGELTYRSAPLRLVPTRSGVLSAVQVLPNLDGATLRPNDTYLLTLQLFDGLGEPIVPDGNDSITWTAHQPVAQISIPDGSAPTSAQLRVTAAGTYTVTARATINRLERSRSFTFRVEDANLQDMTLTAPVTRLANTALGTRLAYTGVLADGSGLTLGEQVQWRVTPASVGVVDAGGFFRPTDPQFIGPVTIQLNDPLSGLQASTALDLFARVDDTQDYVLTSGPRLALTLPRGAIPFPAEIGLASPTTGSANRQVYDAERRAFRVAAPTYHVQFRANQALPGDSLAADAALALQFTPRDTLGAAAITMARYAPGQLQWAPYRDAIVEGHYVMTEQVRRLGQFGVLLQSTPLAIAHAAVLPSPFSPNVGVAKIGYVLASTAPPARVDVTVYNLQGERIRTLLADDPQLPGRYGGRTSLKSIAWDGRTDSGRLARNGRYVIRIRARDSSGEVTQLLPVVLVK